LIGWVSVAFVPFLKYPPSPPAVGTPDTIGSRTGWFFLFLAISVAIAVAAVVLAKRVHDRAGAFPAVVVGVAAYLVVMVVAGQLLPTVNELGAFPADTLWYFRRASLIVNASMWAVIGVGLTAAVRRLGAQQDAVARRRELAAAL
jgi:predicted cobalt transporter CbtA